MTKIISIAEIGVNHHGDIEKAKRMCSKAHDAGATYIKSQYYNPYKVLGKNHPDLNYALQCQFTRQQHEEIARYCRSFGAHYGLAVFSPGDVGWLDGFSVFHKIASRMNQNQEFIAKIDSCKKITFMSIQPELSVRIPERFKLMWCVREYPTVKEDIMKYPYTGFGLSSHCPDPSATLYAVNHGATVIENHLVESREEKGCDVSSSLTFEEYAKLLKEVM
jgi:N-acetylneuraminate synthase